MTAVLALCLLLLAAETALGVAARALNARRPLPEPPAEPPGVAEILKLERLRSAREYTLAKARHADVQDLAGLLLLAGFLLLGGLPWAEGLARAAATGLGLGEVGAGLAFFGLLGLLSSLAALPFDIALTFGLERRFGFGTTSAATFVADRLTGLALAVAIGGPLLGAALWLFGTYGPGAWLVCWAVCALALVGLQYVAPTWLLPLFNTFTPLPQGPLRQGLEDAARASGFELSDISVMDGSRRSTKANAFFAGFGRVKRIALFDTLLERHPDREVVAVLAHEMGHAALGHIPLRLGAGVLQVGLLFGLLALFLDHPWIPAGLGLAGGSVHEGLAAFGLFFGPVSLALGMLTGALSRRHEYQADAFAARLTGDGEGLVLALARLSADNLSEVTAHPLTVLLSASHPPVLERIRALQAPPGP